jgi:hypothetical protein
MKGWIHRPGAILSLGSIPLVNSEHFKWKRHFVIIVGYKKINNKTFFAIYPNTLKEIVF